ncbi:uncharacterized protein LOC106641658 [Copidosoma floridanum]|uniref:uncharacterized protein LOC106641658 n=1 Tax=Copidosoma floridanum TaxID=29053 RepID=UPI000C6F6D8F|nr:uncharacterized protein LOC106641658 [Copidosoma floridanum]
MVFCLLTASFAYETAAMTLELSDNFIGYTVLMSVVVTALLTALVHCMAANVEMMFYNVQTVTGNRNKHIKPDEVARYLDTPDIATGTITQVDPAIKQRLLRHLDSCVAELDLDLGSRPDSGLGSSPGSVTDRVLGPASPNPLDHHPIPALVKQELPELEVAARPDSSTALPGDENNNNNNNGTTSRPTSAFGQLHPPTAPAPGNPDQPPNGQPNPNMLSVVQVIPSRLPDGQVVFLLPSHYVQLAAAAAANGISIGPNPPTAIWAATNMSLLKATDKLMKRPLCPTGEDQLAPDWQDQVQSTGLKPGKLSRLESEQPLDFTTSSAKKLKAAAARYAAQQQQPELATAMVSYPVPEDSSHGVVVAAASEPVKEEPKKPECSQVPTPTRTPSPGLSQPTVKDEEGMWRPW